MTSTGREPVIRRSHILVGLGVIFAGCSPDADASCSLEAEGQLVSAEVVLTDSVATVDYRLEGGGGGSSGTLGPLGDPGQALFTSRVAISIVDDSIESDAAQVCELGSGYSVHLFTFSEVPSGRVVVGERRGEPVIVDLLEDFDLSQGAGFFSVR